MTNTRTQRTGGKRETRRKVELSVFRLAGGYHSRKVTVLQLCCLKGIVHPKNVNHFHSSLTRSKQKTQK